MSWLLNLIPYFLAGATVFVGIFQLIKEWDEYDKLRFRWLRKAVLAALVMIGALTFVSLHLDNNGRAEEKRKADAGIQDLKGKAEAANAAQRDNTKLFVESFGAMSKEVSNLKAEVKTEQLQKKLATVEEELQKTQKAMDRPKAELTFTFLPFNNPPVNSSAPVAPVTYVDIPINLDGTLHVECAALNMTSVDASDVDLNIQICDACKYAKEPANTSKLPGFSETIRLLKSPHVQGMQILTPIVLDIIPPPGIQSFEVGFSYRCSTCVVTKEPSFGTVHISGR